MEITEKSINFKNGIENFEKNDLLYRIRKLIAGSLSIILNYEKKDKH